MDNTFYKMKESKLIELKNKVEGLTSLVTNASTRSSLLCKYVPMEH